MIRGRGWSVGVGWMVALWGSTALAEQVVVLDETWVHAPDLPDSHYRVPPIEGTPTNWVSPIDYSKGKAYVYLEVHTKPTQQETKFQVCFEATPTYACTAQSPTYTEVGTIEWETDFAGFWSPPGEMVDWTKGTNKIAVILKDTMNGKPSADNVGPEKAALYMPTEVRMVVTLVEPGGVYVPPTPTGADSTGGDDTGDTDASSSGDPATTGGSSTSVGTDASGGSSTGEGASTGAWTTGSAGSSTSDGVLTAGVEPDTTGGAPTSSGSSGGTSDGGSQGDSSEGCACSSRADDGRGWLALAGLLFGLGRRRRSRG